MTARRLLRIAPHAAPLTIAADPALEEDYSVRWEGAAPTIREDGEAVDVGYTIGGRLRALSPRRASLTVSLNPAVEWSIELAGGVSGLRADLGALRIAGIGISGGATDLVVDLPQPDAALPVRVEGGVSEAVVRRPAGVPVSIRIDGGVRELRLDGSRFGAMSGAVLKHTGAGGAAEVALHVRGGAHALTVGVSGE
jgi:hypothetical protein